MANNNTNPLNTKNLSRTHSKELAKGNHGKRTRKNSDYKTAATAARDAAPKQNSTRRNPWPLGVKILLGVLLGILIACLILRFTALKDDLVLSYITTLMLGLCSGTLYFIRRKYPSPRSGKLDGVFNAILIVFALIYCFMGAWGLLELLNIKL